MNWDTFEESCVVDMDIDIHEENSQKKSMEDDIVMSGKLPKNANDKSAAMSSSRPKPKIQKVPSILRNNRRLSKFFEPKVISLGPMHHGKSEYAEAEDFKYRWAEEFAKETGQNFKSLKKKIKENIDELRDYFQDEVVKDHKDEELADILLVDVCALLYYIHCNVQMKRENLKITLDQLVSVKHDMFLLENQLPFQVLHLLDAPKSSWMQEINWFSKRDIRRLYEYHVIEPPYDKDNLPTHLLEILQVSLLCQKDSSDDDEYKPDMQEKARDLINARDTDDSLRSAVELKSSGIRFKRNKRSQGLDDIVYTQKPWSLTLKIPRITVDSSSWPVFMNMIAYERCSDKNRKVTSYIGFLDTLIDHPEDVKKLRKANILINHLGTDEELSQLFNEIGIYLLSTEWQYVDIREAIQYHCKNRWKIRFAEFRNTYFSTPWSFIAFIAAFIVFASTIVQTYFTIWPRSNA